MTKSDDRSEQVLALRQQGRSVTRIARLLGFRSAKEVVVAYRSALDSHPPEERVELRDAELGRLDALAKLIRSNERLTAEDIASRVATIGRLRTLLTA